MSKNLFIRELSTALTRPLTLITILAGFALAAVHIFQYIWNVVPYALPEEIGRGKLLYYPVGLYEKIMPFNLSGLAGSILWYLLPLLAAFPFSSSLARDFKRGVSNNYLLYVSKKKFIFNKFFISFIIGTLVSSIPPLTILVVGALLLPAYPPMSDLGYYLDSPEIFNIDLFYTHPLIFTLISIVAFSLIGGSFAVLGTAIGLATRKPVLAIILPCILSFLFTFIPFFQNPYLPRRSPINCLKLSLYWADYLPANQLGYFNLALFPLAAFAIATLLVIRDLKNNDSL